MSNLYYKAEAVKIHFIFNQISNSRGGLAAEKVTEILTGSSNTLVSKSKVVSLRGL